MKQWKRSCLSIFQKLGQLICIIISVRCLFSEPIRGHRVLRVRSLHKKFFFAKVWENYCRPDSALESTSKLSFSKGRLIAHSCLFNAAFIHCCHNDFPCNKMATENGPFKWTKSYLYTQSFHQESWYCLCCLFILSITRFYTQLVNLKHSLWKKTTSKYTTPAGIPFQRTTHIHTL